MQCVNCGQGIMITWKGHDAEQNVEDAIAEQLPEVIDASDIQVEARCGCDRGGGPELSTADYNTYKNSDFAENYGSYMFDNEDRDVLLQYCGVDDEEHELAIINTCLDDMFVWLADVLVEDGWTKKKVLECMKQACERFGDTVREQ